MFVIQHNQTKDGSPRYLRMPEHAGDPFVWVSDISLAEAFYDEDECKAFYHRPSNFVPSFAYVADRA